MFKTEDAFRLILSKHEQVFSIKEKLLYRVYSVPKKGKGKFRTLCEPCPGLKALQHELVPLFKSYPVSRYAAAYEQGCSVKANAKRHIKGRHLFHADIKDFFPSVKRRMFEDCFCEGFSGALKEKLWAAVSYNDGLPVGAPTSPFIANRILFKADKLLAKTGFFITYSRYADDLIFSSPLRIKDKLVSKVDDILCNAGFRLNKEKSYFMTGNKKVTGVCITKERKLTVGLAYKKKLKSEIYDYLVKDKGKPDIIRGRFAHLKYIEPLYARKLKKKYAPLDKKGFIRTL